MSAEDLELGTFTKSEMLDPAVADAAFALQEGAVSGPVDGRFGTVLVRATKVSPETVRPYEEVAGDVKREIAQERARAEIDAVHDAIEDLRAAARPLADVAKEKGLDARPGAGRSTRAARTRPASPVENMPERDRAPPRRLRVGYRRRQRGPGAGRRLCLVRRDGHRAGPRPAPRRGPRRGRAANGGRTRSRSASPTRRVSSSSGSTRAKAIEAVAAENSVQVKTATDLARRQAKDEISADGGHPHLRDARRQGRQCVERPGFPRRLQGDRGDRSASRHDDASGSTHRGPASRRHRRRYSSRSISRRCRAILPVYINQQAVRLVVGGDG